MMTTNKGDYIMTTATFSNNQEVTYKGNRQVKAAWAIINKETQEILISGFSMSSDLAYKSARQRRSDCRSLFCETDPLYWPAETRGRYTRQEEKRRKAHNKKRLEIIDNKITIQILDIS